MSRGTIVSLHIDNSISPASSFSQKKPLAGLLFKFDSGEEIELSIAKDTSRLIEKNKLSFIGIDENDALDLLQNYDRSACWSKLLNLLKRKDYSIYELHHKLTNLGFFDSSAKESIECARNKRFIDDVRFANSYVRSKLSHGWGRGRIERELKYKGIDLYLLSDDTRDLLSDEEEYIRASSILLRKTPPKVDSERKLIRFLMGRGFSFDVSIRAAKNYLDNIDSI